VAEFVATKVRLLFYIAKLLEHFFSKTIRYIKRIYMNFYNFLVEDRMCTGHSYPSNGTGLTFVCGLPVPLKVSLLPNMIALFKVRSKYTLAKQANHAKI
jgi:hypothetical protein